ncbi:MAG: hypothetical protein WD871_01790 [Xanthobacteraceae bacterium]
MSALAKGRNTPEAGGNIYEFPMLAATIGYEGGIAVLDASGWLKPGVTATGLKAVGRFEARADNSAGANGDIRGKVKASVFRFANSAGGDEITKAHIGAFAYIVDDQTVAAVATGRSIAGRIMDVDAQGVWVSVGEGVTNAPGGALLAAQNLADVAAKPTSRANLGVYEKMGTPAFVIAAEAGNVINVAIQLKDSLAGDLAVRGSVFAYLSDDANGDSIAATAPDGGIAIGTDGLAIPLVADKAFQLVSEADGDIDVDITEAGADTWFLILVMPDGRLVPSGAITFA